MQRAHLSAAWILNQSSGPFLKAPQNVDVVPPGVAAHMQRTNPPAAGISAAWIPAPG